MDYNSELIILLGRFINGDITAPDKQKLFDLISYKENELIVKGHILSHLDKFEPEFDKAVKSDSDKIFSRICSKIDLRNSSENFSGLRSGRQNKYRKIIFQVLGIAAALFGAFFLGQFYAVKLGKNVNKTPVPLAYNEIKAPYGSNSEISLPDGSLVMLNAGSILKYRTDYNTDNRDLFLKGEAYFKVSKNSDLPLVVNASAINIKATGTEFNIKAYEDEQTIETTLVEGRVEITGGNTDKSKDNVIDLVPNQKAVFVKESGSFALSDVNYSGAIVPQPDINIHKNTHIAPEANVDQVVAWTEGRLIFRGENLENLCVELRRKYDVKFIFGDEEIKKYRFSGVLLDETLEQVLNVIKLTSPIQFVLSGKTVYLNSDMTQIDDFSKHLK